jgi:TonB family protein
VKHRSLGRAAVLVAVGLIHLAALYALIHARSRPTLDGPPLFASGSTTNPHFAQLQPVKSRLYVPTAVEERKSNVKAWHFPPAQIWPITGEPTPTPSEFSPFMDSEPTAEQISPTPIRAGSPEAAALKADEPRMIVWMRPVYPAEWASDGSGRTITLAFQISSTGYLSDIRVEQSSGSQRLDAAALLAARSWRFTPAKSQNQPIETEATAAITFRF